MVSSYIKSDPDRFVPFLSSDEVDGSYHDVSTFCAREVEPMGRECGMVQVLALAEATGVRVSVEYLDGRGGDNDYGGGSGDGDGSDGGGGLFRLTRHEFGPEDAVTRVTLLYRPGHYDILYGKK